MGITTFIDRARASLGGEPERDASFAHPREEGSAAHAEIAQMNAASRSATEELVKAIGEVPEAQRDRALHTLEFIDHARNLSYSEYRTLVGMINNCRSDPTGRFLEQLLGDNEAGRGSVSPTLEKTIGYLRHVHESMYNERNAQGIVAAGGPTIDAELNARVSDQAMLVLRTVHPLGVNVRNPAWRDVEGAVAYPESKVIILSLGGARGIETEPRPEAGAVVIKPKGDSTVVKFVPHGKSWSEVNESAVLRDGESVVVGRGLTIPRELFGLALPNSVEMPVGVKVGGDNTAWSRGSLCICRGADGKGIVVLDRGTKQPLVSPDDGGGVFTYVPKTIIQGGDVSFGHTMGGR